MIAPAAEPCWDPPVYVISEYEYRLRITAGFIDHYRHVHGRPPVHREIAGHLGRGHGSTMTEHVAVLVELGFIEHIPNRSRTMATLVGPQLGCSPRDPRRRNRLGALQPRVHGEFRMYRAGCRCRPCRDAAVAKQRAYRARRAAR